MKSTIWRRFGALLATAGLTGSLLATVAAPLAPVALAAATDPACAALGGDDLGLGTECVISTFQAHTGTFNLGEGLRITGNGRLDTSGGAFTLNLCVAPAPVSATCDLKLETPIALTGGQIEAQDTGASGNSGSPIVINASRNVVMQAGSAILSDNTNDGGGGGNITITAGVSMTMCAQTAAQPGCGPAGANPGALISAQKLAGGTADGGIVTITVGSLATITGSFYMEGGSTAYGLETGAKIITDSTTRKSGSINITPGKTFFAEPGSVIQSGFGTGTSTQIGGKIFVISGCGLTAEGRITSKGPDPGADLIHLESCDVLIRGLVESTGKGHTTDAANSCDNVDDGLVGEVFRAGKPAFTTGCIEVWGKLVTINSFNDGWAGELNADVGNGGAGGTSWIDIFALSKLTVIDGAGNARVSDNGGATYLSTYAVHANNLAGTSDTTPGVVTALVKSGPLTASGNAFEASPTLTADTGHAPGPFFAGNGSWGGTIDLEALGDVTLNGASLNASGDFGPGTLPPGGHIIVSAWGSGPPASNLSWTTGSGDVRPPTGDIKLNACGTITQGADFHGEVAITTNVCDNSKPTFPVYNTQANGLGTPIQVFGNEAIWALCGQSTISGTKWNDKNGDGVRDPGDDGIDGWVIHLFGATLASHQTATTTGGGNYTFTVPAGLYTICEQLQTGWTQTSPVGPASSTIADCSVPLLDPAADNPTPGKWGYTVDLTGSCCTGTTVEHKDFGNHLTEHHKTGMKFEDLNGNGQKDALEPGIPNWPITLTPPVGPAVTVNTDANGAYSFTLDGPGTYTVCEGVSPVLPATWVQSFPNALFPNPVPNAPNEIVISTCPAPNIMGYQFDVTASTGDFTNNDFGNYRLASKSGTKFNDVANDGTPPFEGTLDGWTIKLFGTDGLGNPVSLTTVTGPAGAYSFPGLHPGTYTVCEVLQATWTQTYPNPGTDGTACETAGYAAWGYTFTLVSGQNETGNDFANHKTTVTCKEDPGRAALLTQTVDTSKPVGGGGVPGNPANYKTVQEAYNAAGNGAVIGLFSKTTENLDLGGTKSLTITQCESAQVTAADSGKSVWKITTTGKLLIIGPDSVGGTIGWELVTGGHELKSIRANGATVAGVRVSSNGNKVSFNNIAGTGIGLDVLGSSNTFKSGTIGPNAGGVHIGVGKTGNSVSGATIQDNSLYGVWIEGSSNTLDGNKLYRNAVANVWVTGASNKITSNGVESSSGDGIFVNGGSNLIQDNKVSKNTGDGIEIYGGASNTLKSDASNSSGENGGAEFKRSVVVVNGTGNKADGTGIPSAAKCSTFFTAPASVVTPAVCE